MLYYIFTITNRPSPDPQMPHWQQRTPAFAPRSGQPTPGGMSTFSIALYVLTPLCLYFVNILLFPVFLLCK